MKPISPDRLEAYADIAPVRRFRRGKETSQMALNLEAPF